LHTPNVVDNDVDCVVVKYGNPEGNRSLIAFDAYDIRWVHNIHCFSQQFEAGKSI